MCGEIDQDCKRLSIEGVKTKNHEIALCRFWLQLGMPVAIIAVKFSAADSHLRGREIASGLEDRLAVWAGAR